MCTSCLIKAKYSNGSYRAIITELVRVQQDMTLTIHTNLAVQHSLCLQPCVIAVVVPASTPRFSLAFHDEVVMLVWHVEVDLIAYVHA